MKHALLFQMHALRQLAGRRSRQVRIGRWWSQSDDLYVNRRAKLTRDRRPTLPPLAVSEGCRGSPQEGPAAGAPRVIKGAGGDGRLWSSVAARRSGGLAAFEPPAFVASLDDFAVVGEPVEQRRRHFRVAEHRGPFTERQVGGDDDRGLFLEALEFH